MTTKIIIIIKIIQFHDDLIFLPLCVLPFKILRERNGRRVSHGKQQIAYT